MTPSDSFRPEELALHGESLRRLAQRLVRDGGLAEDLVQEAYAAALASPPRSPGALAAWLARVVRTRASDLRRGAERRAGREHLCARPESDPEQDAAERLAVHGELLAAVRSLREPYRTAVVLRYYEDRPPAEIARRLGVPVKTVKTRLARALEELRTALDARHDGGRRAWALALAPLASPSSGAAPLLLLRQGLAAMGLKTAAAASLLAALALFGIWSLRSRGDPLEPRTLAAAAEAPVAPPAEPEADLQPSGDARRATPAALLEEAAAPALTGSLSVRSVFADGSPAAGVAVVFRPEDDPALERAVVQVVADAHGLARARELHPGHIALASDRGGSLRTELAAGEEREVRFEIPRGVDVEGVVLDRDDRPVAEAGIWLTTGESGWLGGRVVARSDARGAFRVRSCDPVQSVGARAPGFAPSKLVDLEQVERADDRCTIELRLTGAGAAVEGRVLGEGGKPIAEALVALGRRGGSNYETDGTRRELWSSEVTRTGADGSFLLAGAEPGETTLSVRAEGYVLWHEGRTLTPGQTAAVEVVLERGATVRGLVRDEGGTPAAGITVQASRDPFDRGPGGVGLRESPSAFGRALARSDAAGAYELRCVPPGLVHLLAGVPLRSEMPEVVRGRDETDLEAAPGAELTWNPELSLGLVIRGRLVSADGGPPRMMTVVYAMPEIPGASKVQTLNSLDGTFVLAHCDSAPYTLTVFGQDVSLSGIWPDQGEVELTLPQESGSAEVTGRIDDAGGRLRDKPLGVVLESDTFLLRLGSMDGDKFLVALVDPGRYRLFATSGTTQVRLTDWFDVAAGQKVDLGELVTKPGGALVVHVDAPSGAVPVQPWALLGDWTEGAAIPWDGEAFRAESLEPGQRLLSVIVRGFFVPATPVEIRPGETTELRIALEPAVRVPLALGAPPAGEAWNRLTMRVRDQAGTVVAERSVLRSQGLDYPYAIPTELPAGTFTLSTELDTGRTAERAFVVAGLATPPAEVLIDP